jgi:mxaK protein
MRQALKDGPDAVLRALPLIELAKQSYRGSLRLNPEDWDARYNLERALWLAPEVEQTQVDRIRRDVEERVMSTLQSTRADLP